MKNEFVPVLWEKCWLHLCFFLVDLKMPWDIATHFVHFDWNVPKALFLMADFEDFEKSLSSPVRFSKKWPGERGDQKMSSFHDSQNQNPKCGVYKYVCMYVEDFFRLSKCLMEDLTRTRFRAQFLLDFFETWQDDCFYRGLELYSFWSIRSNEGRVGGYANSRIFRKWKPTNFSEM